MSVSMMYRDSSATKMKTYKNVVLLLWGRNLLPRKQSPGLCLAPNYDEKKRKKIFLLSIKCMSSSYCDNLSYSVDFTALKMSWTPVWGVNNNAAPCLCSSLCSVWSKFDCDFPKTRSEHMLNAKTAPQVLLCLDIWKTSRRTYIETP